MPYDADAEDQPCVDLAEAPAKAVAEDQTQQQIEADSQQISRHNPQDGIDDERRQLIELRELGGRLDRAALRQAGAGIAYWAVHTHQVIS